MRTAVAISTTGDEHRMGFLETCVRAWDAVLEAGDSLFVTVDGNVGDTYRVAARLYDITESVFQVGQGSDSGVRRHGVAVNKNTGLELLMYNTRAGHLFLSDDDTWPLFPESLDKHRNLGVPHSMLGWGKSRLDRTYGTLAEWKWPRGSMLYQTRSIVSRAGGMDERFGPGGHEHAEYSQRIANITFRSGRPFVTPASYATRNAHGAAALWHSEDMPRFGESIAALGARRKAHTSLRKSERDWDHIHKIMAEREGSTDYVPFRAHENGRASATLCQDLMGQGAGGES